MPQTSFIESSAPRGACPTCPFNAGHTEDADAVQNYGCLPTGADIVTLKRDSGQNWTCHGNERKVCAGLCHAAVPEELDLSQGGRVRYRSWYVAGEQAAVDEAASGVLLQVQTARAVLAATSGSSSQPATHLMPSGLTPEGVSEWRALKSDPQLAPIGALSPEANDPWGVVYASACTARDDLAPADASQGSDAPACSPREFDALVQASVVPYQGRRFLVPHQAWVREGSRSKQPHFKGEPLPLLTGLIRVMEDWAQERSVDLTFARHAFSQL